MRSIVSLSLLCALVSAAPTLNRRQEMVTDTDNDVVKGECKPVTFIFARGSTEDGNLGAAVGGPMCNMLRAAGIDGGVGCQGVGGAYKAKLAPNFLPKGTDDDSINEAVNLFKKAMKTCPNTKVVAGGYSQGSAVMLNAIKKLSSDEKDRINGVVLYGYTKNLQTAGSIPTFPDNKLKVFCRDDDGVCTGVLLVTPGHLAYPLDGTVDKGANWLVNKVQSGSDTSGGNSNSNSSSFDPNNIAANLASLLGSKDNSGKSDSSSGKSDSSSGKSDSSSGKSDSSSGKSDSSSLGFDLSL